MLTFHGNATTAVADKFHGGQLAFAHVGLVRFRFAAERAFLAIATGVAEMPRIFGHGATSFTGIGHLQPPLYHVFDRLILHTVGTSAQRVPNKTSNIAPGFVN